jgi:hypothetical protein
MASIRAGMKNVFYLVREEEVCINSKRLRRKKSCTFMIPE